MTSVSGHLTKLHFGPEFNDWNYPPPERLFDGPVHVTIDEVSPITGDWSIPNHIRRIIKPCLRTLNAWQGDLGLSSSGPTVIVRESILVMR